MLESIYVVRHGFRSNWVVDPKTGQYANNIRSPTGIDGDPALASYGVQQSKELARELIRIYPPIEMIYSSPFYRCLQTIEPFVQGVDREVGQPRSSTVNLEPGLGEWYGVARFNHPIPASYAVLKDEHFSWVDNETSHGVIPNPNGESIEELHDRVARVLHEIIEYEDKRPQQPRALLICTHAATMIAIGRALTGNMPADPSEEDFRCGTCSISEFNRRIPLRLRDDWRGWQDGNGVGGGWDVILNGDCSHLSNGEERTW
ncbi:MAG: hypothetical protein M1821_009911 [Bathelium mastoideum]|nr:MAG: hypothetical protein M1821_009911 [Bathelium mastoideum]KAI9690318.1 MAG: hypothetical protein M1822_009279 [Bathelium mastoideum]